MKKLSKILAVLLSLVLAIACFASCGGGDDDEGEETQDTEIITLAKWLEEKGNFDTWKLTVTVKTVTNSSLAIITDDSGAEVNLFGVYVDGEFKNFTDIDILAGDILTIADGKYNEYEGTVEISEATLVNHEKTDRKPESADFDLTGQSGYLVSDETYDREISIVGENGVLVFNSCVFNKNITLYGGIDAKVVLNNCTFAEGVTCIIISDFEEGTVETTLPKFMMFGNIANVTIKKAGAAVSSADKVLNVNGTEYPIESSTLFMNSDDEASALVAYDNQEADLHNVALWKENGDPVTAHIAIKDVE